MQIFRSELGLPQYMHKNYTTAYSQLNNSIRHVEDIDNDHQCSDIPFQKIQSACFLLLEVSKLVFILAKEYTKHRKRPRVTTLTDNSKVNIQPKKSEKQNLKRSESFPKSAEQILRGERRTSLQLPPAFDPKKYKDTLIVTVVPVHSTVPENKMIYLLGMIKQLCLRSFSFIALFVSIGLVALINGSITRRGSFHLGIYPYIVTERLMIYVLIVLLSVFDLDIVMYFKQKFNLPNL